MRLPHAQQSSELSINMTPMIDVVFLLIIFFLVSSHLARRENHLPVSLPHASAGIVLPEDAPVLTVTIDPQGDWRIGGRKLAREELGELFAGHAAKHGESASIRIRGDREVPYERLSPLLNAAHHAGLASVSIAVLEPSAK